MSENEKAPLCNRRFQLRLREINVPDSKLLDDLRQVGKEHGRDKLTHRSYPQYGKYSSHTFRRRFGSWNNALKLAGLSINNESRITEARLFENLERVWVKLGRQPARRDMVKPISEFSEGPYRNRFGSWNKALLGFMSFINEDGAQDPAAPDDLPAPRAKRGNRDPDLRLRFRVMLRDNFKCKNCGRSPATHLRVVLHVDHVVAWSKGGATTIDNLRTLCSKCNLGKGTLDQ